MHCAHCRHDNAATTRFCVACGAVLFESSRDGRRRRVLRPWGLLSQAPATESPAMPDLAQARAARLGLNPQGRRLDWWLGGAIALVAAVSVLVYPRAKAVEVQTVGMPATAAPATEVVAPAPTALGVEVEVSAPPLVEPSAQRRPAPAQARPAPAQPRPASRVAASDAERVAQRLGATEPASFAMPARDPIIGDGRSVEPLPAEPLPAPAPPDRWQALRDALTACSTQGGIVQQAICSERARLEHCDSYWGHVALCPHSRVDSNR